MLKVKSTKTIRKIWYHKLLFLVILFVVLSIFGYHNLLTYHAQRIFSQRMYMYGYTHLHGNILQPLETFGFEKVLYEPSQTQTEKESIYLLILVSSSPHSSKSALLRQAIRQTWGNCKNLNTFENEYTPAVKTGRNISCKLYFYMGKSNVPERNNLNKAENKKHNDLVIGDFADSYHNMTRKLLFGFKWASDRFQSKYILKTDDDVFINVPQLISLLNTKYSGVNNLYGGHVYYASVIRDEKHRHFVTREAFPNDWYPPFNKGGLLILSGHLLGKVLSMSTQMKRFQIDDAYIGILMNHIKVLPTKFKEFALSQWLTYFIRFISTCDLNILAGIGDNLTPSQLLYLQETVHHKASWYCIRFDYFVYFLIFLVMFILAVVFFFKQRYCPWLTFDITVSSIKIFIRKCQALKNQRNQRFPKL